MASHFQSALQGAIYDTIIFTLFSLLTALPEVQMLRRSGSKSADLARIGIGFPELSVSKPSIPKTRSKLSDPLLASELKSARRTLDSSLAAIGSISGLLHLLWCASSWAYKHRQTETTVLLSSSVRVDQLHLPSPLTKRSNSYASRSAESVSVDSSSW
jgi:hypothetical protein